MIKEDLVYRLRKRAEIRRSIPTRKSVQEGKPDRIASLLDEAAKERAKKQDLVFDIDFRDIVIPEFCPILGLRLQQGSGKVQASSPSLDRIDPNKGYTKENIQVISYKANTMKNDASVEMLLNFAKWVNNEYN